MKSMTGYGRAQSRAKGLELDVTIRTVNGRFLETRIHLPREYVEFESELKEAVTSQLVRGTVDIFINRRAEQTDPEIVVRTGLAKKWLKAQLKLAKDLKLKGQFGIEVLQQIPDLYKIEEPSEAASAEKKTVQKLLEEAIEKCQTERAREGQSLAKELLHLLDALEKISTQIESLREEANKELEKKYRDRLERMGFSGQVDDQRIAQEIVMQIDRTDISEEISRLKEHIKAYRNLLKSKEAQGKKLDFYAQELLREVNTIGSKSHLAKLTGLVVEAKAVVEKIREQVQNVE